MFAGISGRIRDGRKNPEHSAIRKSWRLPVFCIAVSLLLYLALSTFAGSQRQRLEHLERESYGGFDKVVPIVISGLTEMPVRTSVELLPREYSQSEAQAVFDAVMEQIGGLILQENPALAEIRSDLNLLTELESAGVRLRWQSGLPDYINNLGQVTNETVPETGIQGYLGLQLSAGNYKADYELAIGIFPPVYSDTERQQQRFFEELRRQERAQKEQQQFLLPDEYEGRALEYYPAEAADYTAIPLMGAVIAVLLVLRSKDQEKQQEKARERQLLLDYSEVITKLLVFIGAGMTVRLAWERIVGDYQNGIESGKRKPRYVYEEMSYVCSQMQSGESEGRAYREFGERCRLQPYLKLSSLLEQNRRTGTKNLSALMRKEVERAFEERKNLVKRLGEEAGTKLAGPLFLMLGVIMVLILFPAIMNMNM